MSYRQKRQKGYPAAALTALLIIGAGFVVWYLGSIWYHSGRTRSIEGIPEPKQHDVTSETISFEKNGWNLQMHYKCAYDIRGLAVHTRTYPLTDDMGDSISPVDIGIAWGLVAEKNKEVGFKWSHGNRKLTCAPLSQEKMKIFGGTVDDYVKNTSNNHLIPADKNVEKELLSIRKGDYIRLRGYLVNIDGERIKDGKMGRWYTSTSREDTDCEVIYVTNVDWIDT